MQINFGLTETVLIVAALIMIFGPQRVVAFWLDLRKLARDVVAVFRRKDPA